MAAVDDEEGYAELAKAARALGREPFIVKEERIPPPTPEEWSFCQSYLERFPPTLRRELEADDDFGCGRVQARHAMTLALGALPGRRKEGGANWLWYTRTYRGFPMHWRRADREDPPVWDATPLAGILHASLLAGELAFSTGLTRRQYSVLLKHGPPDWQRDMLRESRWMPFSQTLHMSEAGLPLLLRAAPLSLRRHLRMAKGDDEAFTQSCSRNEVPASLRRRPPPPTWGRCLPVETISPKAMSEECEAEPPPPLAALQSQAPTPDALLAAAIAAANEMAGERRRERRGRGKGQAAQLLTQREGGQAAVTETVQRGNARGAAESGSKLEQTQRQSKAAQIVQLKAARRADEAKAQFLRDCRPAFQAARAFDEVVHEDPMPELERRHKRALLACSRRQKRHARANAMTLAKLRAQELLTP